MVCASIILKAECLLREALKWRHRLYIHWPRVNRSYRLLYNLYDVMLTCQLKPHTFLCSVQYELYEVFKDS